MNAASPTFEDPCTRASSSNLSGPPMTSSLAMSCFSLGVMASLLVSSAQKREVMFYGVLT